MAITQANHFITLDTPLGKDNLILTAIQGEEQISQLFHYQLEAFSNNINLSANDLVGKAVSFTISRADNPRYFHGYVGQFFAGQIDQRNHRSYRLIVYPWLWLLTHTANCRIFQDKSVSEISELLFKEYGFSDYRLQLKRSYNKREYCVQYNESDFAFISRLLEEEGIFYFFQHEKNKHILILADHNGAFIDCPDKQISYADGTLASGHIHHWEHRYQFGAGVCAINDYNFTTPKTSLLASTNTLTSYANSKQYQIYQYPGQYQTKTVGEAKAKLTMESIEAQQNTITAASNCSGLVLGGKFQLAHHDCSAEKGEYIITAITQSSEDRSHVAGQSPGITYQNTFTCIPVKTNFRAPVVTTRPIMRGPQTAKVVGPADEVIYTDKYGRVKLQFHWDREGEENEQSSCWVRVGQLWSGKDWGAQFIPRIGQEVIVDFIAGDPDQPLIVGCVYNGEQTPIYALPNNKWQSGIKTQSKKGSNELRFDDQEDKEQVYLHAQKELLCEVEQDATLTVKGKQTITIQKDRNETLEEGNEDVTIKKGNRTVTLDAGNESLQVKQGNRKVTISMGNDTLEISQGNQITQVKLGKSTTEAMQGIELKVGQSSIKVDQSGITLSGLTIKIQGQTMTEVKANAMLTLSGGLTRIN